MDVKPALQILGDLKSVAVATVDAQGSPQVRIIDVNLIGERLYFLTARGKAFYKELMGGGEIAVTGMNRDYQMIRLQGRVCKLAREWLARILEADPPVKALYAGTASDILEPFCLVEGEGELFDLSGHPIYREAFRFGACATKRPRYRITAACTECRTCEGLCPMACITPGTPYEIDASHCLHCGYCAENCPVEAIVKAL